MENQRCLICLVDLPKNYNEVICTNCKHEINKEIFFFIETTNDSNENNIKRTGKIYKIERRFIRNKVPLSNAISSAAFFKEEQIELFKKIFKEKMEKYR